jgi:8-oxo-dGTP diphosphatase
VPAYLIRHAHAGSRSAWKGDDDLRPLSAKGQMQAESITKRLKGEPLGQILSSPSLRCMQTVEPLAEKRGLEVEADKLLLEGADPDDAIALMFELAGRDPVLCSHGDLIPKVIRRLVGVGMKTKDANISQKGSIWIIEIDDGQAVKGRYLPPG